MNKWILLLLLLFAAAPTPGADYAIKSVPVLPIENYPAQATVGRTTIAADPYDTNEKSFTAFDVKNLNSRGYFPVHVIVRNGSSEYLNIRTRNIILITSSGEQLYITPAAIVVDDVIKSGMTEQSSKKKSDDLVPSTKAGSPLTDFTAKELIAASMAPGSITDGFLFFFNPDPKINLFKGSTLFIPKLEEEGTRNPIGPFTIYMDQALMN